MTDTRDVTLSLFAFRLLIDSVWDVARRRRASTTGPSASHVAEQIRAWHDASAMTSYGRAQRRAYMNVLRLLGQEHRRGD